MREHRMRKCQLLLPLNRFDRTGGGLHLTLFYFILEVVLREHCVEVVFFSLVRELFPSVSSIDRH